MGHGGSSKAAKQVFFFEKKNQKTFNLWRRAGLFQRVPGE
jgi:hypothetical protein